MQAEAVELEAEAFLPIQKLLKFCRFHNPDRNSQIYVLKRGKATLQSITLQVSNTTTRDEIGEI